MIFDFREPNIIRAGCSPLTTRFVDVYDGLHAVAAHRTEVPRAACVARRNKFC